MPRNIYFSTMNPVLIIGRLTAILPFSANKTGQYGFHFKSLVTCYSIIVYLCIARNELFFLINLVKEIIEDDQYNAAVLRGPALLTALYALMTPLIHWTSINRIAAYWHQWDVFQKKAENCFGSCPLLTSQKRTLTIMLLLTVFNMTMAIIAQMSIQHWHVGHASWHWFISHFEIYYITLLWIVNCSFIGNYAQFCVGKLKEAMASSNTSPEYLREIVDVWLELSKQLDNYAESYAPIFLLTMVLVIVLIVLTVYIMILLQHTGDTRLVVIALSSGVWMSSMCVACDIAHRTNEKMAPCMKEAILQKDMTTVQVKLQYEMLVFLKTINIRNPKLSIGYIVTTDRTLFLSIFSNVAMYLIVLRQIGISI